MKVVHVILFFAGLSYGESTSGPSERSRIKDLLLTRKNYKRVRCTRRYTTGSCLESVRPVWTYVPHLQTCAERLGCPADFVANRFGSAEHCQEACRELVYLYMYLQEVENSSSFVIPAANKSNDAQLGEDSDSEYQLTGKYDSSSDEHATREPDLDDTFRRHDLREVLAKLSKMDSDHSVNVEESDDQDGGSDDRQPLPSSMEAMWDDRDVVLPQK